MVRAGRPGRSRPDDARGRHSVNEYIADDVVEGSLGRLGDDEINPLLANLAEALEILVVTS
jgi:hypothetical protein